jgi:capsular exopolysaccharide synthesis family protein
MDFKTSLAILWRWKGLFLAVLFTVLLGALAAVQFVSRQYEVKSVVFVTPSEVISSLIADMGLMNAAGVNLKTDWAPENIVQMAKLAPLVQRAVDLLQMRDSDGKAYLPKDIIKYRYGLAVLFPRPYLKVENTDDTQMFELTVYSTDPDEAVMFADTMAELLRIEMVNLRIGLFEAAEKQTDERITKQLEQYQAILGEIRDFQLKKHSVKLEKEIEVAITKLDTLMTTRQDTLAAMASLTAKMATMRKQLKAQTPDAVTGATLKDNSYVNMLRDQLTQLQIKQKGQEASLTANHPDMIALKRQIEDISKNYAQALRLSGDTSSDLQSLQREYDADRAKLATVEGDIAEHQANMAKLPQKSADFGLLQLRQTAAGNVLTALLAAKDKLTAAKNVVLSDVRILQHARIDEWSKPERPKKATSLAIAGFVGLCLALFAVYVREQYDDTLRGPGDVAALGLPCLGRIPRLRPGRDRLVPDSPADAGFEAYRSLKNDLAHVLGRPDGLVVVLASPEPGAGRTVTAANLALAAARDGKKTVAVDADCRNPALAALFDLPDAPGLTSVLYGERGLADVIRVLPGTGLSVVPPGHLPAAPGPLFASDRLAEVLAELRRDFEVVVCDAPALALGDDALALAALADATLVVARTGATSLTALERLLARFRLAGARVAGLVRTLA